MVLESFKQLESTGGKYLVNHKWQNQSTQFYYKKAISCDLWDPHWFWMQKNYVIRSIFWKFKPLYPVYSILKNSLESNLDSKGKKERIYISYVKRLFECLYHSTIERNCIEVTKGLLKFMCTKMDEKHL